MKQPQPIDTLEVAKRLANKHDRAIDLGRLLMTKNKNNRQKAQCLRLALSK
jgi:hypothetical protein